MTKAKRDWIQYRGFLALWKASKQRWPGMCAAERFIRAIVATSDDKWPRASRLNTREIDKLIGKESKSVFSDALTRRK